MWVNLKTGLLEQARQKPSPNFDARPDENDISLLVVHGISLPPGKFEGDYIDQLFCNQLNSDEDPYFEKIAGLKVSSHLLIRRDGDITQYVPFQQRAWHAGKSSYNSRTNCNDFSIGIELEGTDDIPYTDAQYQVLSEVILSLNESYSGLDNTTLVGHSDIAPGRKTDPGPVFDWKRLRKLISI